MESFSNQKTIISSIAFFTLALLFVPFLKVNAALYNNAPAVDLLGQYDQVSLTDPQPVYTKNLSNDRVNRLGFAGPSGMIIDYVNHRFFLADSSNNRILVYNLNNDNSFPDRIPDNVLGQPVFYTGNSAATQAGLSSPRHFAIDTANNYLFVSDSANNRILVFDIATITDGEAAIHVLGQSNFTSSGIATTQTGLNAPHGLAFDPATKRLFVSQTGNDRVSVFDVTTITDGEPAINVLGQSNFTTSGFGLAQNRFNDPRGMVFDPATNRLYISEELNRRVTVYDVASITDGENAINVIGQANFTTNSATVNQSTTPSAYDVSLNSSGTLLYVSQRSTQRITTFDVATITDGEPAVNVLGQANFSTSSVSTTQSGFNFVQGVYLNPLNNLLYVTQSSANRLTIFDVNSITDGENAVDALGQYDESSLIDPQPHFTKIAGGNAPNRLGFDTPTDVLLDSLHHRLFVSEQQNRRVLVYNLNPDNTLIDRVPDFVLAQTDFASSVNTASQIGTSSINDMAYDPIRDLLYISQSPSNRVLVYDVATITNGENAINVLGQTNFTLTTGGVATSSKLISPSAMALDLANQRLFVGNLNRVTVFDVSTITDNEPAVNVLGQAGFTTTTAATTQTGFNGISGLLYDPANNLLYVSQSTSNRITIFDVSTIIDNEPAIHVLGQPDFTTGTANVTVNGLSSPRGLALDDELDLLYVAQSNGNRVTVFDVSTITDNEPAINVLGQPDFTSSANNSTQEGIISPNGIDIDPVNKFLYVVQGLNSNRVTLYEVSIPSFTVTESAGNTAVTEGGINDSFSIVLDIQPTSDVIFNITPNDPSIDVSSNSITFTNTNWNTPQFINVSASQDNNLIDENATITISVDPSSDVAFTDLVDQTVNVSVTDNDFPAFTLNPSTPLNITEGSNGSFTVVLNAQPASNVVFDLNSSNPLGQISPSILTFTSANWDTPQTVTVTIAEDENYINESFGINISVNDLSSDDNFDNLSDQQIAVIIKENDFAPGGSAKFGQTSCSGNECIDNNFTPPTSPETSVNPNPPTSPTSSFSDSNNHWASTYIGTLADQCDVQGYRDSAGNLLGKFGPDNNITRAELIKILINCQEIDLSTSSEQIFSDVNFAEWYSPYIHTAYEREIVEGYADGTFQPNNYITREEAIKVILLSKFSETEIIATAEPFSDVPENQWYSRYISFAYSQEFVSGYKNADGSLKNIFGLGDNLTRAEAAKIIVEVLDL